MRDNYKDRVIHNSSQESNKPWSKLTKNESELKNVSENYDNLYYLRAEHNSEENDNQLKRSFASLVF